MLAIDHLRGLLGSGAAHGDAMVPALDVKHAQAPRLRIVA
jgi:hypothetical protein